MKKFLILILVVFVSVLLVSLDAETPYLVLPKLQARGSLVSVPVHFDSGGQSISAVIVSIEYRQDIQLENVVFNVPDSYSTYVYEELGKVEIGMVSFSYPAEALDDGVIATLQFRLQQGSDGSYLNFSQSPPVSFGSVDGYSIPGESVDGWIVTSNTRFVGDTPVWYLTYYLPLVCNE